MVTTREVEVVVLVDDDHMSRLSHVAAQLQNVGLNKPEVQPAIGTISGVVTEDKIARLRQVSGVTAVERSREVWPALTHPAASSDDTEE
ncbi:MAG TPA: hypothetical protein VKE74_05215, partial [Gemmataceae bacterium]|nr:hypothetical protein [Gemmataceae bacterium]